MSHLINEAIEVAAEHLALAAYCDRERQLKILERVSHTVGAVVLTLQREKEVGDAIPKS